MPAVCCAAAARTAAPVSWRPSVCKPRRKLRCPTAAAHKQQQQQHAEGEPAHEHSPSSRRAALALLAAAPAAALIAAAPAAEAELAAAADAADIFRSSVSSSSSSSGPGSAVVDTTVTHRLFLDVGVCPEAVRVDRTLGDKNPFCSNPQPLGRIVVDLYGRAAPGSVANIVAAAQAGAYNDTQFSKVLPGRYLLAGAQGGKRSGLVQAPEGLPSNPDILEASSFRLTHRRPGTVSLNLSENEDEDFLRFGKSYRNLSLLITTGPGPVPSLDGENIVVGQVSEGLDVVAAITQVPTFLPNDNSRAFNQFASFIGDERAAKTRAKWGRPLQAVVITNAGVL